MAKLFLRFEEAVLKEMSLSHGVVTIGRLPDNVLQIDNPAVSGHHAKIYWDQDHYVIEDNNSLNGTYVNQRRATRTTLKDDDVLLIGKHTVVFKDDLPGAKPAERTATHAPLPIPAMEETMILDTKKAKEMLVESTVASPVAPGKERIGTLTVLDGKTDQPQYVLSGKLTVIGKSDMATVKLKGWFAPEVAAIISKREGKYFLAPQKKDAGVKVKEVEITTQQELNDGDELEVKGVKMLFSFQE